MTRTSDLVWWWRQQVNDRGLGTWFQPSVSVQRHGVSAAELGAEIAYPEQYLRARPNNWKGYRIAHPDSSPAMGSAQADRPSASSWDRPEVQASRG